MYNLKSVYYVIGVRLFACYKKDCSYNYLMGSTSYKVSSTLVYSSNKGMARFLATNSEMLMIFK